MSNLMRTPNHDSFIVSRRLASGKRAHLLEAILDVSSTLAAEAVTTAAKRAQEINREVAAAEHEFATGKSSGNAAYSERVHEIDAQIDSVLVGTHQILGGIQQGAAEGTPSQVAAQRLLSRLFPGGVGALTQSSIVEQHYNVTHLVAQLRGDLAADVNASGLPASFVDRLETLTKEMQAALHVETNAAPNFDRVREGRQRAHRALLQVIVQIFATYGGESASDEEARARLLAPVISANRDAKSRRSRGGEPEGALEAE
jgi:hypothetical protein